MEKLQKKTSYTKINILFYSLGIITLLLVWFILSIYENSVIVPSILDVIIDIGKLLSEGKNLLLILFTILKIIVIVTIAFVISFLMALASLKSIKIRYYFSPIVSFMRTIPVASFVVILLILIGSKFAPVVITLFVLIPIIYESIYTTFIQVDKDIVEETKLISNIDFKVIMLVFVPMCMKTLLSCLLSSFGLGLKVLIMSEVITQGSNTIGGIIANEKSSFFNMTRVFSWTIILIIIILFIEIIIKTIDKKMDK